MKKELNEFTDEMINKIKSILTDTESLYQKKEHKIAKELVWRISFTAEKLETALNAHQFGFRQGPCIYNELSEEDDEAIKILSDKIYKIEKIILSEYKKIHRQIKHDAQDPNRRIDDTEIEIKIWCALSEKDPLYDEDDDNHIVKVDYPIIDDNDGIENTNWNDSRTRERVHHCWLFHDISAHLNPILSIKDLLRIGEVHVDIDVRYQQFFDLGSPNLGPPNWAL
ncbi:hypothetical protein MTBBW1_2410012 [Desulfamplus magnetovallimortis]|uniref:Uncharacterized protein n=1 Tax=Desulfamplus magnetovallimortis TaxID=1246637 RepID=A0A1W1HE68_9BACT|nr:hypothetical protein [Desulfamplus magnetovallimortis]SLM30794.1 hypothetical protein MTBBW1_2410012 [Desulfamplus magnetovallimortis]